MERTENYEESMGTYFYPCADHGALPEPCSLYLAFATKRRDGYEKETQ